MILVALPWEIGISASPLDQLALSGLEVVRHFAPFAWKGTSAMHLGWSSVALPGSGRPMDVTRLSCSQSPRDRCRTSLTLLPMPPATHAVRQGLPRDFPHLAARQCMAFELVSVSFLQAIETLLREPSLWNCQMTLLASNC